MAAPEDIPLLAAAFLEAVGRRLGRAFDLLGDDVIELLQSHDWPGNVRELQNLIERAALNASGPVVHVSRDWLGRAPLADGSTEAPVSSSSSASPAATAVSTHDGITALASRQLSLEALERRYVSEVLQQTRWRIEGPRGAAAVLGMPPSMLRSRIKKLGLR